MGEDGADRQGFQEAGLPSECIRGMRKEEGSRMTVEGLA